MERQAQTKSEVAATTPPISGVLQRACACGQHTNGGGTCSACEDKSSLQRSTQNAESETHVPSIVHQVLRSPGQPLDAGTRATFETRFGQEFGRVPARTVNNSVQSRLEVGPADDHFEREADRVASRLSTMPATNSGSSSPRYDFSGVRVHFGAQAAESARSINALAYTVGQNIVFGAGQYAPATQQGRELLAHELTHVVQQGAAVQPKRIQRRVNPGRVTCANYPRTYPIFTAIGTTDPVGALQAADTRAIAVLTNTIDSLTLSRTRIQAGAAPAWPTASDCTAQSMRLRLLIDPSNVNSWTGTGPNTVHRIIRMLTNLRGVLEGGHIRYSCLSAGCDPGDDAFMIDGEGFLLHLCRGFWNSTDVDFRALTIIHELAHIYYNTEDRGFLGLGSSYCIEGFLCDMNGIVQAEPYNSDCRGNQITAC